MKFDNERRLFYGPIPNTEIPSVLRGTGYYVDERYYEDPTVESFIKNTLSKFPLEYQEGFKYDFALSFAGEDRDLVEIIARELIINDSKIFYDNFSKEELIGKDLSTYFKNTYGKLSKYVVLFISKNYEMKEWTNFEFEIARDEAKIRKEEFILPIRLDDTILHGIKRTIGYIDFRTEGIFGTINLLLKKLSKSYESSEFKEIEKQDFIKKIEMKYQTKNPQSAIKITRGNKIKNNIELNKKKIERFLKKLRKLFDTLYDTKAATSYVFTKKIHNSEEMQDFFGIIARESSRPGVPIDDEAIYFLNGKYYIIPNSATLRILNESGQYEDLIAKDSSEKEISKILNKLFDEIIISIKNEYDNDLGS